MAKKSPARYNMYEAKTKLSELVEKALKGQEVILMNRGKPIARVVPFEDKTAARRLGFAKDIEVLAGFNDIPNGFEEYT